MRIGIDIRCLQTASRYRGIGYYTYNLILNLLKIDRVNQYYLFAFKDAPLEFKFPEKTTLCFLPRIKNMRQLGFLYDIFTLKKEIAKYNLDIFHFTSAFEFFFGFDFKQKTKFKKVVTLYDLIPFHYPKEIFSGTRAFLKPIYFYLLKSITFADKIITISDFSAEDLANKLKISKNKIDTAYPGVNEDFFQNLDKNSLKSVQKKYSLPDEFLLYVGGANPNKNLPFLINIAEKTYFPLVVAGHKGKDFKGLEEKIKNLKNSVYFLDFVPSDDLIALFKLAKIFVFPSLYEGFGMPPLEAMASGTPVISSNSSSMPEAIGDAGKLIYPTDENAWIKEIKNLWENEELRKELSIKGIEQAKKFSWEQTAGKTIKAYREAGQNG